MHAADARCRDCRRVRLCASAKKNKTKQHSCVRACVHAGMHARVCLNVSLSACVRYYYSKTPLSRGTAAFPLSWNEKAPPCKWWYVTV